MNIIQNGPLCYIRFGISRKKEFLKDVRNAYDGLVLPANILLYQYKSTPSVIFMCSKPFFVDPMSYLFGQPYENFKQKVAKKGPGFKPSFHKLIEGHGFEPNEILNCNYLELLNLLSGPQNIGTFVEKALEFQQNNVWNVIKSAKSLLTEDEKATLNEENYRPDFLIPPYFLYSSDKDSITTQLNWKILEYCRTNTDTIFPMLFITKKGLENRAFLDQLIKEVTKYPFQGYVLWIEDFDERYVTTTQIKDLIYLTYNLSKTGSQIVMLYGGFFSTILYYFGITCICHGLAYGEARTVSASSQENSGPAPVRYYIKDLHSFLTLDNALIVLRKRPDLMCTCSICKRVMHGDPENVIRFQKEEELAEMHFLQSRYLERKMISSAKLDDIIEHLDWISDLNDDLPTITKSYKTTFGYSDKPIIELSYINNWKNALIESRKLT